MAVVAQAGAAILRAPAVPFHGECTGTSRDPFGRECIIGHAEDIDAGEMQRRLTAALRGEAE